MSDEIYTSFLRFLLHRFDYNIKDTPLRCKDIYNNLYSNKKIKRHNYFYKNVSIWNLKGWESVTTKINKHNKFNAHETAKTLSNGKSKKYGGKSTQHILNMWDEKRIKGEVIHKFIHTYLNDNIIPEIHEKEFSQFLLYHNYMKNCGYKCIKTEWSIYDPKSKLAGTIDALYCNGDKYILVDWKVTDTQIKDVYFNFNMGNISKTSKYDKFCLQLGLYDHILRTCYTKEDFEYNCNEMHIVQFKSYGNYEIHIIYPKEISKKVNKILN
jgi:hypothetical protein